jgi:hypothetical protein
MWAAHFMRQAHALPSRTAPGGCRRAGQAGGLREAIASQRAAHPANPNAMKLNGAPVLAPFSPPATQTDPRKTYTHVFALMPRIIAARS